MNNDAQPEIAPFDLELADRLESLVRLPLDTASDIQPWTDAAGELRVWIDAHSKELPFRMPDHLMFFFHDADIRVKEPDYRARQEGDVLRLVRQLRGERVPEPERSWWRFW